ncbi:macro domain-like protein [Phlegmacium glaucopus]|nr:macro domain-like protein [Phlegmacium glaucopus]
MPPKPSLCKAWREAISEHFPNPSTSPFVVIEGKFQDIDPIQLQCDCIVSPANSYAIMGGGFDLELSRVFKGPSNGNIWSLTDHCQTYIHDNWHGFVPPGSCAIIPLPEDVRGPNKNPWHAISLAILPTMHTPENVSWHKDLVYNAMWALLTLASSTIRTVLMTGLGTGYGGISAKRCAQQMVLAVKHFQQDFPTNIRWEDVRERNAEIERTITLCDYLIR